MSTSIALIAAVAAALTTSAVRANTSVSASSGDVTLSLSLAKGSHVTAEPIIATVTVLNATATARRLAEADTGYTVTCVVTQVRGLEPMPARILPSMPAPPSDYGWTFGPREGKSIQTDIQMEFAHPLPKGEYSVRALYFPPADIADIWHGRIETPELSFSVVSAGAPKAEAAAAFGEYSRKATAPKSYAQASLAPLKALKEPARGGEFAKYAGFWLAFARQNTGDREGFIAGLREYVAQHPDAPFYGLRAALTLGTALYKNAEYAEARRVFEKLPDGNWKMDWLRKCDAKLAAK